MRKILGLILIIVSIQGFSQPLGYQYRTVRERLLAFMVDSGLHVPRYNGIPSGLRNGVNAADGLVAMDTLNGNYYIYHNTVWIRMAKFSELTPGYTTLSQFVDETAWRTFYSNGSGDITALPFGTSGKVLTSNGASAAPTWETPAVTSMPTLQQVTDAGSITTNSVTLTHVLTVNGDNNSAAAKLNTDNFGGTDAGGNLELKTLFSNFWASISPINSYSAAHYFKLAQNGNGSGTDTVATLADVRAGGGGGGGISDADYGDIVVSGSGSSWIIDNLAVTNAKINDVAYSKITSVPDAVANGSTKGVASFNTDDFNSSGGNIGIDYINGQSANSGTKGFLTSGNFNTFDGKNAGIQFKDEGSDLGTIKTVNEIDFVGSGVTATRASDKLTVTINGSSGFDINSETNYQNYLDKTSGTYGSFTWVTSGTAAAVLGFTSTTVPLGFTYAHSLETGTTTTGLATHYTQQGGTYAAIALSSTIRYNFGVRVQIPVVSDVTDRFEYYAGYMDDITGSANIVDGVYFTYTDNVSSGQWVCHTESNNTKTSTASGITVNAGQNYELEVTIIGGTAYFYIDKTLAVTTATNVPDDDTNRITSAGDVIIKSAGTTNRKAYVDWLAYGRQNN